VVGTQPYEAAQFISRKDRYMDRSPGHIGPKGNAPLFSSDFISTKVAAFAGN
jgi:hypothetical protein